MYHMRERDTEIEDLAGLLKEIRVRRLVLLEHGVLWAPNTHVPLAIRRAIKTYRHQLLQLMGTDDSTVCPDQRLHRKYWRRYGPGCYTCMVCHRWRVSEERQRFAQKVS